MQQALSGENLLSICKQRGHEVLVGLIAAAHPSAPMADGDYELLRDEILDNLRAAMPVDGVILRLHGAMTAEGYDDCEGDILKRMRAPWAQHLRPSIQWLSLTMLFSEQKHQNAPMSSL